MKIDKLPSTNSTSFWSKFSPSRLPKFLLASFLVWTLLLSTTTLQIQHSCSPMIHWQNIPLPKDCIVSQSRFPFSSPDRPSIPTNPLIDRNLSAGTAGTATAAVMAISGAPLTLALGAGILIWFLTQKALQ